MIKAQDLKGFSQNKTEGGVATMVPMRQLKMWTLVYIHLTQGIITYLMANDKPKVTALFIALFQG